jgi:hypothetical protein
MIVLSTWSLPAHAQLIRGRIIDGINQNGLGAATITIVGVPEPAQSDESGKFVMQLRRSGTVVLTVRRLGYLPGTWSFDMTVRDTADLLLPMQPVAATLDTVSVRESETPAPHVADFEHRRSQKNGGTFITHDQIENNPPVQTADLLRRVPSVEVRMKGMRTVVISRRGPASLLLTPDQCVMPLGRDGLVLGPEYSINDIPATEIYGIEIYGGPATIPTEFRSSLPNGNCGLIMIWTRSGMTEVSRKPKSQ